MVWCVVVCGGVGIKCILGCCTCQTHRYRLTRITNTWRASHQFDTLHYSFRSACTFIVTEQSGQLHFAVPTGYSDSADAQFSALLVFIRVLERSCIQPVSYMSRACYQVVASIYIIGSTPAHIEHMGPFLRTPHAHTHHTKRNYLRTCTVQNNYIVLAMST